MSMLGVGLKRWVAGGVLCLMMALGSSVLGVAVTLTDENASVVIDPESDAGMSDWVVDGVDHLEKQWFYFRVGDGPEQPLNALPLVDMVVSDGGFGDPNPERVVMRYADQRIMVTIGYVLTGSNPGEGFSHINEDISIDNLTREPLDVSFFQYSDFDLAGTARDDWARVDSPDLFNTARQNDGVVAFSEAPVTPVPDHFEVSLFDGTLAKLTDGDADDLSDVAGPIGPGNLAWAFQWSRELAPLGESRSSLLISKLKRIETAIPEPGVLGLMLVGVAGAVGRRRRVA